MNKLQFALAKAAEEANELGQILMKAQIYGPTSEYAGQTNQDRIIEEASDLLGCLQYLSATLKEFGFEPDVIDVERIKSRLGKNDVNLQWAVDRGQVTLS